MNSKHPSASGVDLNQWSPALAPQAASTNPLPWLNRAPVVLCCARMKVEQIAEAIAKLPPDQLARFRRWFTAFEAGRADHAKGARLHCDQIWPPRWPCVC